MPTEDLPEYMRPKSTKKRDLVLLVVGGRTFVNRVAVWSTLDRAHRHKPIATLVHGGTPGAESLAGEWALRLGLQVEVCRGEWARDEELAVIRRNARMIEVYHPDGVIIFPDTAYGSDLAARAGAARIGVWYPHVNSR